MRREVASALVAGIVATALLALLIVAGSRRLTNFDAALVGYTFATLFATFGIVYRYAMWLQRPPTWRYWVRGWQLFLQPRYFGRNLIQLGAPFRRDVRPQRVSSGDEDSLRGAAHWLIMWGCLIAAAITFPLVFGWIHFETVPGDLASYRAYVLRIADAGVSDRILDRLSRFSWPRLGVVAGHRRGDAGHEAPHD